MTVHNNRAYHQEVMHLQKMAGLHNHRMDTAAMAPPSKIPTSITPSSRNPWACTAKDRSRVPLPSVRRYLALSPS